MKPNQTVDRIERAAWKAGQAPAPFAGEADWMDGVMLAIRRLGPLQAQPSGRLDGTARILPWVAAIAACLAIVIGGYMLGNMHTDTVMAGLLLDDPAGLTVNMVLAEM